MRNSKTCIRSGPRLIYPLCKGMNMQAEGWAGRPLETLISRHDSIGASKVIRNPLIMNGKGEQLYKITVTLWANVGCLADKHGFLGSKYYVKTQ